jgi:hypothetical protein
MCGRLATSTVIVMARADSPAEIIFSGGGSPDAHSLSQIFFFYLFLYKFGRIDIKF